MAARVRLDAGEDAGRCSGCPRAVEHVPDHFLHLGMARIAEMAEAGEAEDLGRVGGALGA